MDADDAQTVVVTPPAFEPVAIEDAKAWMGIDSDDNNHDTVVTLLIQAMREYAENYTHSAFIQRTLRSYMPCWPVSDEGGNEIELDFPPLVSVSWIKYRDTSGALTTLAADQYDVHDWRKPAVIVPAWGTSWPAHRYAMDAIQVQFVAGYPDGSPGGSASDARANIPAQLKLWMQARAATLFKQREQLITGTIVNKIPREFSDALLDPLVIGTRYF